MKKNRLTLICSLLALAFVFCILQAPASAVAEIGDTAKYSDTGKETIDQVGSDFEPSELLPYYEDGSLMPERTVKHVPSDDYSTVRVLLNFESTVDVSRINLSLYGAYYIDQNLKPIVGTAQQPAIVSLTASYGLVTVYYLGSIVYQGATVDINRVLLGVDGGYAHVVTDPETQCSDRDYLGSFRFTATGNRLRLVNHIPTAHYIYGIVPYEMNDGWGHEALVSQAIACKAYAFGYSPTADDHDITASKSHMWYRGYAPQYSNAFAACVSAVGEQLFYDGEVVLAFFDATNGGETTLPSYAFGSSSIDGAYSVVLDSFDMPYGYPHILDLNIEYGEPVTNTKFRQLINDEIYSELGHSAQLLSIIHADVNTRAFPDTQLNLTKMDLIVRILDNGVERSLFLRFDVNKLGKNGYGVLVPQYNRTYRIFWGEETTNGYVVHHCRYGNGIGLSQQAAKGRCANGQDHYQILEFYYPNMELMSVTESNPEFPYSYSKQVIAYGTVTASSARLRGGPSTDDAILDTLTSGTHVDIVSESNGWLVCIANNKLGYIRGDLVSVSLFPAPAGGEHMIGMAAVRPNVTDAVLYTAPSQYSQDVFILSPGSTVEVWHTIGSWYHVRYAGRFLYLHSSKVTAPSWNSFKFSRRQADGRLSLNGY